MEEKTVSSKHLAKRAYMLTHWRIALENMQGLDLIVLLWKKILTNESCTSFSPNIWWFWSPNVYSYGGLLSLLQCQKHSSERGNIFEFL